MLKKLKEKPLGPAVIRGNTRVNLARPVKRDTEHLNLALEVLGITLRNDFRMNAGLDSIILGWKSEGVPPYGVEHIVPLHAPLASNHIHADVGPRVPDMQAVSRGVWKLYQRVKLLLLAAVLGLIELLLFPHSLPLLFYPLVVTAV